MNAENGDVVVSVRAKYRIVPLPNGKLRHIKTGDRFNVAVLGEYFPGCAESVIEPESATDGMVLLRIIAKRSSADLFQGQFELREGPSPFALCDVDSVLSIE